MLRRGKRIYDEFNDPFRFGYEPEHWAKAEALAETDFAAQSAGLARRVGDSDYPFPEILDHVAGILARDFR